MKRIIICLLVACMGILHACKDEEKILIIEVNELSFSTDSIKLSVGEKMKIISEYSPKEATDTVIVWKSDNSAIATVDGHGVVTGLKEGIAKVSGTLGNGKAELTVTVTPRKLTTEGLLLAQSELSLVIGESYTLKIEVYPEDGVEEEAVWTSMNEEVVAVDENGVLTPLQVGDASVVVKVGEKEATCVVHVYEKIVPATGISFNVESLEVKVGETLAVDVKIEPEDATERNVEWTVQDVGIASVVDGMVTGVMPGETVLTARLNDDVHAELPILVVQPATAINLYETTLELGEGAVYTIFPQVLPEDATDKTITWTSSDESIAIVVEEMGDWGDMETHIKALSPGKVTLTATCGEATATCELTVTEEQGNPIEFEDPKFLEALVIWHDLDANGRITDYEAERVADVDVSWSDVTSLQGIEYFINVRELNAADNQLASVDLSKNLLLEELQIGGNPLTELDLSANSKLLSLDVEESTDLKTVNLGDNVNLQKLVFSSCPNYVVRDVSKFVNLVTLLVDNTATETLDVSANVKLRSLYCGGKENFTLTGLDKLSALETFYMYGSSAVEVLDFTHSPALLDVSIQGTHPNLKQVILPAGFNGEVEVPEGVEIVD